MFHHGKGSDIERVWWGGAPVGLLALPTSEEAQQLLLQGQLLYPSVKHQRVSWAELTTLSAPIQVEENDQY